MSELPNWTFTSEDNSHQRQHKPYVRYFLSFFLASVGIATDRQNKFVKLLWPKFLVLCFVSSFSCVTVRLLFLRDLSKIVQTLVSLLHMAFLNFSTFSIYLHRRDILDMVQIKDDHFGSYYDKSLVVKNYMTSDEDFKVFLQKWGTLASLIHATGFILAPFFLFLFSGTTTTTAELADNDSLYILPSWYPWSVDSDARYLLTYALQFVQVSALCVPIIGNFLFIIYFVIEIRLQKANLCTSLNNIVVYAYWESMSNESEIFQVFATSTGATKSYDELLYTYLQDCMQHHIMINEFIEKFISCYSLVFIGCVAYSVSNMSLIAYSLVLLLADKAKAISFLQPIEGLVVVISFILLYSYLGEVITSINNSVRNALFDIPWYEQSSKYQRAMLTFMCLTQKDIVLKAGVKHIASYKLFTSVLRLSYSFFNILLKV
uniref:Odorant receptor n=1 Tax=Drosicha corpulenta TaxID=535978 RepID=A0A0U3TV14_9HEMI|nr:odorant receptor 2 [Drosicha corpulenta]